MNIETVNELIQSLESAGELSIQETKVMALAKAFKQLAAENVALKSFGDKLNGMHNALNGEGTGIQGRAEVACQQFALEAAMEEFDAIETPDTDRIVAGIKADGVEEWVSSRGGRWNGTTEEALKFAKQLREGKSEEVKS
ncbi:hypothetical protein [Klebsiella michiganensis]|uniref:hypothetical protein n=1 Tax=Klebsiella michiganensis TaxID=1134687 RepID=UPI00287F3BAF|nr:hypothetical protein [Klebsiella michiganensis]MDS7767321.1 hypothetical protein [Klebsiella michiganensis]MDS7823894.1 hypothetical protein [Klebsiella michiganensis]MDS7834984.1 hypothetical protein [Klebsiella michiganensis]